MSPASCPVHWAGACWFTCMSGNHIAAAWHHTRGWCALSLSCQNAAGGCREEEIQRLQQGQSSDEEGDGHSTTDDEGGNEEEDDGEHR